MNKKPNIIFILTDDQGAWAMHCAGNGDVHTPNLDRIAAQESALTIFLCIPCLFSSKSFDTHWYHSILSWGTGLAVWRKPSS